MYHEDIETLSALARERAQRLRVLEYHFNGIAEVLSLIKNRSPILLWRQVATFRGEDRVFFQIAKKAGLTPVVLEYTADVFFPQNGFKKILTAPHIVKGVGRGGGIKTDKKTIATPRHGVRLCDVDGLVEFHHKHRAACLCAMGEVQDNRVDISAQLAAIGNAAAYYRALMLVACIVPIFESFHAGEHGESAVETKKFRERVVEPAIRWTMEQTGLHPLIVNIPPWEMTSPLAEQTLSYLLAPEVVNDPQILAILGIE